MKHLFITTCLLLLVHYGFCVQDNPQQLYEDALLYREFHRAAAQVEGDYYAWLATEGNAPQHHYALYYAGIAYVERGEWQKAAEYFEKFAIKNLPQEDKALAKIKAGLCYYQQGEKHRKEVLELWKGYEAAKSQKIKSAVGYAYARANINLDQAQTLCQGFTETDEGKRNLGWVYFQRGELDKARTLLEAIDLKAAQFVIENKSQAEGGDGAQEKFYFYDPAILSHLSTLYLTLAAQAQPTLENAFAVGMSRYELGRYDDAQTAFSVIQNDHFAAGRQKLEGTANALTWKSQAEKEQWMGGLLPHLETRNTRAIAAALDALAARIKYEHGLLRTFDSTQDQETMRRRLQDITAEISWESKEARKNWLSERAKELKAGNIDAIVAALNALASNYENAQYIIQQARRYFYNAVQAPVWLGICYLKRGRGQEALRIWGEAKAHYASNPDFWSELGLAYSQVMETQNDRTTARQIAVKLLENMDDKNLARASCQKALSLLGYPVDDIGNSVVKAAVDYQYFRNLGLVLKREGEDKSALKALEKGRNEDAWNSLEENGALFFSQIAQCYYSFKACEEIMAIWSKLTEEYPASYQIHYTMRFICIIYGKGRPGSTG